MQTWKKTLSGILSAAMLLSMCTVGVSAEEQGTENSSAPETSVENPSVENPGEENLNTVNLSATEPGEEEPGEENLNTMNLSTMNLTESGATEPTVSVGDFATLKAAVENENVNEITLSDNIAIPEGPTNNLVLNRPITINGDGHTLTKTFNTTSGSDSSYGDYEEVFEIRSSGVTISNVKIAGLAAGMKDEAAIYVAASGTSNAPIVIENCTFIGADSVDAASGGSGIISQAGSGAYLEVKNNTFTNVKHGMWFNGISNATISGNTLNGVKYTGIWVEQNSSNIQITNNTMTNVASANYATNAPEFACGIYVNDGCTGINLSGNNITLHAGATNGAQIVAPGYDPFTPTVDLSPSRGVTLSGHTFSGNVDPRTFTVTDAGIHQFFGDPNGILEGNNPWTLKDKDKKLTFGALEFGGLNTNKFYTVQQINPALNYAYVTDEFPNDTKIKTYKGSDLDKLYFMISEAEGNISFKIVEVASANDTVTDWTDVPSYTFTNEVTFESSEKPGDTVIEVSPKVETDASGTATAKAEVSDEAVTKAVTDANTNTTVEIVATTDNNTVEKAEIKLDSTAVSTLVDTTGDDPTAKVKDVEIKTDVGTITLSSSALEKIASDNGVKSNGMTLEVEQETPSGSEVAVISVTVKSGGSSGSDVTIKDLEHPITISFFIGKNLQNPVLFYKASDGTLTNILSSSYDPVTGIITGTTRHLSAFAAIAPSAIEDGGIGKKVTLKSANANAYLTIQVTNGGANSIYTVQATADVVIYVTTGTVLNVWETASAPTFSGGNFKPTNNPTVLVSDKTIRS